MHVGMHARTHVGQATMMTHPGIACRSLDGNQYTVSPTSGDACARAVMSCNIRIFADTWRRHPAHLQFNQIFQSCGCLVLLAAK